MNDEAAETVRVPWIGGFRFAAVEAGVRKADRLDVALAVCDSECTVAGVFTRNVVRAAPVELSERRVAKGSVRAVLVNSGNANACTGEPGMRAALETTGAVSSALGLPADAVLCCSTGVIGVPLPKEKLIGAVPALLRGLTPDGAFAFAQAIITTDRWTKVAHTTASGARILGIAKGAGMIHPDVGPEGVHKHATMLAFLFTDAAVSAADLELSLAWAADRSFNACTVDGDTSTNDTVLAFASGASGVRLGVAQLGDALLKVCSELARSMVADGEGATLVTEIKVLGLPSDESAKQVARTVATSLLVKTALHGRDVNWGRLLAAAGRAGVSFEPNRASVRIGGVEVLRGGLPVGAAAEDAAGRAMKGSELLIELTLGDGPGIFSYFTSDIGHGYIDVNASYRT